MPDDEQKIKLALTHEAHMRLAAEAQRRGVTTSDLLREALHRYIAGLEADNGNANQ